MKLFGYISWFYSTTHTRKAFKKNKYEEALELANYALDKAVKVFGPGHIKTAQTIHNVVVVNITLRDYEEAEKHALRALEIMEQLRGKDNFTIIDELRNMETLYRKWGKDDIADEYDARIEKIIEGESEEATTKKAFEEVTREETAVDESEETSGEEQ